MLTSRCTCVEVRLVYKKLVYNSVSQIVGRAPQGGRDTVLEGARMTPENMCI